VWWIIVGLSFVPHGGSRIHPILHLPGDRERHEIKKNGLTARKDLTQAAARAAAFPRAANCGHFRFFPAELTYPNSNRLARFSFAEPTTVPALVRGKSAIERLNEWRFEP
jgi:hypothetical protein